MNSLTPFEKLELKNSGLELILEEKQELFSENLSMLRDSVCKDSSDERLSKYYSLGNINDSDVELMLGNLVDIKGELRYPVWIDVIRNIINDIDPECITFDTRVERIMFGHILVPFVKYFQNSIREVLPNLSIEISEGSIFDSMSDYLFKELVNISEEVLFKEFGEFRKRSTVNAHPTKDSYFYQEFVRSLFVSQYENLFSKYPMLARNLSTKVQQYVNFVTKVFTRFNEDRSEIEYFFNVKFGKLESFDTELGDQHNGQSTVILGFDNSSKLVYKPTSSKVSIAYNHFLDWVNDHLNENLNENLKSFKVVDKDEYSWLEFITNDECKTIDDVRTYYKRAGIILGVAYFLNAHDYHCENIIASGNSPVLVDHETVIGHSVKYSNLEFVKNIDKEVLGTVLETSLLPYEILDEENIPHISGFGSSNQLWDNVLVRQVKDCNKDTMRVVTRRKFKYLHDQNKPMLKGVAQNLANHQDEFKKGFQELYSLIVNNKEFLLSEDSPLVHFRKVKVRFIFRSTTVYGKILGHLRKPEYLQDSNKYGLRLELIARAHVVNSKCFPLLSLERQQMLKGDIPAFYIEALDNVFTLNDDKGVDLFKSNALESAYGKIRRAGSKDYKSQIDLVEESVLL